MPRDRASTLAAHYPEAHAGGFSRVDGTVQFYTRIAALLEPGMHVLNLGAGRGEHVLEDPVPFRRDLQRLRGRVARVTGLDIDAAVLGNPDLDAAHVIAPDGPFPLPDASVDLVLADNVFEHVTDPAAVAAQIARVLRPGGWLCARTPNRHGYIAIGARVVPRRLHEAVLARVQPERQMRDVFPASYQLNTRAALRRHFPAARWQHHVYPWTAEPAYVGNHPAAWTLARGALALVPPPLRDTWFAFLRHRPVGADDQDNA